MYSYAAQSHGDLSITEGDIIRLLSKVGDEWLEGQLGNGQKGVFPTSFVHIIGWSQPHILQSHSNKIIFRTTTNNSRTVEYTGAKSTGIKSTSN
jgi:hypothetical protein